jgi:signal transduction histidine kinase
MLDNIRHGICYYGPDRRVIAANALAARLGGHQPADLIPGVRLDDLIDEQLATGAVPPEATGIASQALALDRSRPAQYVRPASDGRVLEVTSDPTPDGGFVVTSTDITRLVEAEAVAQSRAATLGVMLDNIRQGIVLFGADRRIVAANPRVRAMLGVPDSAELVGLHMHDYIRLLARLGVYGTDADAEARAEATIARFDPAKPDRHVRTGPLGQTIEVVSDPTPDGGFVLTYTDVTEDRAVRSELEAARRAAEAANLAKSRFLATMTHELRTPLNAVIGFSEALQTAPNPERSSEYLGSIHEAGHHLLSLVDDILDVTRAETTGFQVAMGEVEVRPLCESVVRVMRAAAAAGQVRLGLELGNDLPLLRADEVRLRQVLLNLLSNAVKFTPAAGSVTLSAAAAPDGALVIRVKDTGIGVRAEDMPLMFQPFSQVDSSLNRRFPGSGLGLYLSRALAEAQGATLTLESSPGEGATAILRFPPDRLLPAAPTAPEAATPEAAAPPPPFAP